VFDYLNPERQIEMETRGVSATRTGNIRRYGLAILAAVVALWLRKLLAPVFGEQNPYHTAWAAVVFSAWYCGVGPSVVTILLEATGIWYWFLPPLRSFGLRDARADLFGLLGFVVFSACIVALGEATRRSLARSMWAEQQLRDAHSDLEAKVQQRTAELSAANDNLRELSSRLQQLRDEERRQIARELHDSVGQMLAALSMNIAKVRSQAQKLDTAGANALAENGKIVEQISREIRTISHLLHPPLLDVAGLASAVRWYVDGYAERSKIKVDVAIPSELSRLSNETEIAIFRIVQECLVNVHRHSGSDSARIVIDQQDQDIVVEVRDSGKGIPAEKQLEIKSAGRTGVGFRGMRERLRQLGGTLSIQSNSGGTLVTARIPLRLNTCPELRQDMAS